MKFILTSLIASVVLTLLINILPLVFPNAAVNAHRKIEAYARRSIDQQEAENQPRVKVFFPWKVMLTGSIVLTILINLIGLLARGH